ncbi:MAG: hypothetical protein OEN01_06970 [Candidatus Krumholzibacteria bacterium]|nr:hypothetical protein [Candidatus Krumholzibacteria bacterium]
MERAWVRIAGVGLAMAAIGIPAGRFEAAKQYTLAYKMNKAATFAVQVARKHRNHRNFMGNDLITNSEGQREYGFTVKSSNDDGLRLELECTKREYKTDDTQALMSPDFSELIGRKVNVSLSSTGELSDFKGFDDLPEIAIPGSDERLGEQGYVNEVIALFLRLPKTPVAPGGSWSDVVQYNESVGDTTLPLTVNYTYTLMEETRYDGHDCVKIKGEYTINMSGSLAFGGLDLALNLTGMGTDTIYFAWKKGMFLSAETHAVLKGSADNEDMGVAIPMNHDIKTITSVRLD